jgi:hypothetical protein
VTVAAEKKLKVTVETKAEGMSSFADDAYAAARATKKLDDAIAANAKSTETLGDKLLALELNAILEVSNKIVAGARMVVDAVREFSEVNDTAAQQIAKFDSATSGLTQTLGGVVSQNTAIIETLTDAANGWKYFIQDIQWLGDVSEQAIQTNIDAILQDMQDGMDKMYRDADAAEAKWLAGQEKREQDRRTKALELKLDAQIKEQKEIDAVAKKATEARARATSESRTEFAKPGEQGRLESAYIEGIQRENAAEEAVLQKAHDRKLEMLQQLLDGERSVYDQIAQAAEQAAAREAAAAEKAAQKVAAAAQKKNDAVDKSESQQQQLLSMTFGLMQQGAQIATASAITHANSAKSKAQAEREAMGMIASIQAVYEAAMAIKSFASQDYAGGAMHAAAAIAFGSVAKTSFMGGGAGAGDRGADRRRGSENYDSGSSTRARRDRSDEGGGGTSVTNIYQVSGNIMGDRHAARYQEQLRKVGRRSGMATGGR